MFVLGIDPDTTHAGFAIYNTERKRVARVGTVSAQPAGAKVLDRIISQADNCALPQALADVMHEAGIDATLRLVVEHQHHRKTDKRPDDIINLAVNEGVLLSLAACCANYDRIILAKPREWKGDVPKAIHQNRILAEAGLHDDLTFRGSYEPVPGSEGLSARKRLQIVDAIGLAMWGAKQW